MQVEVDEATGRTLRSMAAIRGCTLGEAVSWSVEQAVSAASGGGAARPLLPGEIDVFATYKRVRVSAVLDKTSGGMLITSGVLAGQRFGSPSGAAKAVVKAVNPAREHSEQNGKTFWRLEDGQVIRSILP